MAQTQVQASDEEQTVASHLETKDLPSIMHTRAEMASRLDFDSGAWSVTATAAGRSLVAVHTLPAATRVFTERPTVVAYPEGRGPAIARYARLAPVAAARWG